MKGRHRLHKHLRYSKWYIELVAVLKKIRLRHGKASLHQILTIFIDRVSDNHLFDRSHAVAFNFTLSLFPSIIFLFALIPYIHTFVPSVSQGEILRFLQEILPQTVFQVTTDTIYDTVHIRREGLLSLGVFFAFVVASNGVHSLMKAFNASYKTFEKRNFFQTRRIALLLTILLAFALIFALLFLVVGQFMLNWLLDLGVLSEDFLYYIIIFLRFIVVFVAFYLAVACIYYWGPAIHDKWRFFSLGSTLATLLCVLVSFAFSMYVTNFGTYNKLYGSIGAIIALMVWQWLMSLVLLLGFEFNASIDRATSADAYDMESDGD